MTELKKIRYKCGFSSCSKRYVVEEGYYARVDCKHEKADMEMLEWYPIQILEVVEGRTQRRKR